MTVLITETEQQARLRGLRRAAARQLDEQAARAAAYQAYFDGDVAVTAIMDTEDRRAFRALLAEAGASWCELVVNAVAERLQVTGFRFGDDGTSEQAWAIWQASQMDADAELVQTDALVCGSSFVLVQRDEDNPAGVSISPESPLEATVLYEPGNRRRRLAGYKRYAAGEAGADVTEVLILPDVIATWYPREAEPVTEPPAGAALIEIVPQPRTLGWPRSELTPALVIQDRINTLLFNRMVSADYGAFRQIWATGVRMARQVTGTDAEGQPVVKAVRPYDVGANRLLANEDPAGRFGSFPESTLSGYLAAVEQDVNHLAAITQTPPHYLLGQMVNLSADAIKAAEAGLVSKVRRRALHIGEAWEEVMRTALALAGSPAAGDIGAEVLWADFETRSEGQRVDALVKMRTLGVPLEVLWERWGASPQEVARWQRLSQQEAASGPEAAYAALLASATPAQAPARPQPPPQA